MRVCFPVESDQGLASTVCDHFGSASLLLVIDTQTRTILAALRLDPSEGHGARRAVAALAPQHIQAVIVGGIGPGALGHIHRAGWQALKSGARTVGENLDLLAQGQLAEAVAHGGGGTSHTQSKGCGCGGH